MEWLILIPILVLYLAIVIAVISAFAVPFLYLNERLEYRKREGITISKWDYAQEIFLVVISPTVLTGLGVLYLLELSDLKF